MRFRPAPQILPDFKGWVAFIGDWSFVITLEERSGKGFENYTGYAASWKNRNFDTSPFGKQPANRIDGGPWKTFLEAENACKETYKKLRNKN